MTQDRTQDRTQDVGPRRALARSVLLAVAVHGLFAALVLVAPARQPGAWPSPSPAEPVEPALEISLDERAPEPPRPLAAATDTNELATGSALGSLGSLDQRAAAAVARATGGATEAPATTVELDPGAAPSPNASPKPSSPPAPSASPEASSTAPGALVLMSPPTIVGGTNPFLAPGALPDALRDRRSGAGGQGGRGRREAAPSQADAITEAKRRVEAALREPARARERELGLGPEGPVLKALGQATSGGTTPVNGRATFLATANGAGEVVGLEVLSCDGARVAWASAANDALAALRGQKLRMPSSAKGAEMKIEVTSAWKLPSGHDPGADVSVLGLPVAKGEGKQSTKVTILDPIPKIHVVELSKDVKIPIPQVELKIFATDGDPSDVAAKPRRVVHTRLVESKML